MKSKQHYYLIIISAYLVMPFISVCQTTAHDYDVKGCDLGRQGKYKEAIKMFDKAIELDPNSYDAYYDRGKAKLNLQDYKGAVADLDIAIRLKPRSADAYNNRAIAKKKSGDYKGAISDYTFAINIEPKDYPAYYNRGIAKYNSGDEVGGCSDLHIAAQQGISGAIKALRDAKCN